MSENSPVVCIITFPISHAGFTPLANLANIFCNFSKATHVISSRGFRKTCSNNKNKMLFHGIADVKSNGLLIRLFNFLKAQIEIVTKMSVINSNVNIYIFFIGGELLLLPIFYAKVFGKKVVLCHTGSIIKSSKYQNISFVNVLKVMRYVSRLFSDKIVVYSKNIIVDDELDKFRFKVAVAREHFIDFGLFGVSKIFCNRDNVVGYIGRFTQEKGVWNLIQAIPLVFERKEYIKFMLIGEGPIFNIVEKSFNCKFSCPNVAILKWLSHKELPKFLNELKLIVSPSFTEGLPNIALEAMACAVPVLATPVGALPDIVKNGETGFLLKSNDPKHIADRIIELLDKPELLEKVSINAYNYVRENFSFQKTLESWQKIFNELRQP